MRPRNGSRRIPTSSVPRLNVLSRFRSALRRARTADSLSGRLVRRIVDRFDPIRIFVYGSAAPRLYEFATWRVFAPNADDVLAPIVIHTQAKIGFWDAMIVLAAAEAGCDVLWTEDLNDGQTLRGVRIQNPFTVAK